MEINGINIISTIKTENIEHYSQYLSTPLDVLLENYRNYITSLEMRCKVFEANLMEAT